MDTDGHNATQLTSFKGVNSVPTWSDNGNLLFVSNRSESWDIWSMKPIAKQAGE
jgi:Tol biopolymer transport system component